MVNSLLAATTSREFISGFITFACKYNITPIGDYMLHYETFDDYLSASLVNSPALGVYE
ncbi:hypothetical protein [Richelia intracellularis]|uniref:hypothetical protein n=1 Tax=Richelia intracellularis TaxID=1164990 RepID=UPI0012DDB1AE|nr:hypothetical protein [Richelia intracellularis]